MLSKQAVSVARTCRVAQPSGGPPVRRTPCTRAEIGPALGSLRLSATVQRVCQQPATCWAGLQQPRQQCKQRQWRLPRIAVAATADNPQQEQLHQQDSATDTEQLLGHIDLPPSRSTALWLNDLDGTQLQQQASDWGYLQVGQSLPEGLSLNAIAETMPEEHFDLDLGKAVGYLAMSIGVMAAGYLYLWYWHSICPLWQQICCWIIIGTGYFGVFQSAVDCSHFAFWPSRPVVQDVLGAALMAPALISYEIWRLKYFNHLM